VFKAGPDVFVNLPSVHVYAQLGPRSWTEDNCTISLTCKHMAPVFIFMSTETAFFVLASIMFVTGVSTPKDVKCFERHDLMSSSKFVRRNLEGVPYNGAKYQRCPVFLFREVVSEFRTMDGVGNVIWELRGDFLLLNDNRDLLFGKVNTVCTRFHVWSKGGLCFGGKRVC
jgi:hypothetical protein